jgi:hypothetical protein
LIAAVAVLALSSLAAPAPSPAQDGDLSGPFEVRLGHVFAYSLEKEIATMALISRWDAPITVDYDVDTDHLDIELLGARTNVEKAKDSLDRFRDELLTIALARANERHDTSVTTDRLSIVYRNREQWEAIIRYRDGKYEVPK